MTVVLLPAVICIYLLRKTARWQTQRYVRDNYYLVLFVDRTIKFLKNPHAIKITGKLINITIKCNKCSACLID